MEIRPSEVIILRFRCIGGEHITQHVLLAGKIIQILIEPYRPIAGCGNLIALEVEELIRRHVVRQVIPLCFEHSGEDDAVENDVIFSDEMDHTRRFIFPPFGPISVFLGLRLAKFDRIGDISDRSIKPYIEHFTFRAFYRNGNTPVEVTCDRTRFESTVQPAFALTIHVGSPFLMVVENPVLQP